MFRILTSYDILRHLTTSSKNKTSYDMLRHPTTSYDTQNVITCRKNTFLTRSFSSSGFFPAFQSSVLTKIPSVSKNFKQMTLLTLILHPFVTVNGSMNRDKKKLILQTIFFRVVRTNAIYITTIFTFLFFTIKIKEKCKFNNRIIILFVFDHGGASSYNKCGTLGSRPT